MAKISKTYIKTGSLYGGDNIHINLIKCEDNIVTPLILQSYILHWCHTYLLHPGMDKTEAMIWQHLYCHVITKSVQKEVNNCDTSQHTKRSNIKYGHYQLRKLGKYYTKNSV